MNKPIPSDPTGRSEATDFRLRLMYFFLVVAVGLRILFWVMTDRVWEDALITLRHAENAAQGVGLTHHPKQGDPVHGFTSPISVLIPLAAELLYQGSGMNALRLSSLVAAALTILVGYRIAIHRSVQLSSLATGFFLGFLAIEFHQILFSMGGMETQWIVLITLFILWQFLERQPIRLGLACSLALWGRPDGVIMVGAVFAALVIQRRWREVPLVGLVCGLAFAPWLVFCQLYYGTFVPHTIIAKKVAFVRTFSEATDLLSYTQLWSSEILRRMNFLRLWLSPVYGGTGSAINFIRGARPLQVVYFLIACVGACQCYFRRELILFMIYTLGFAAYMLIMLSQPAWWYILPWLNIVAFLFAIGIDRVRDWVGQAWWQTTWGIVPCVYLALYAFALTRTFPAERHIQLGIEDACRANIGRWLDEHAGPDDWISCECLGYIGSYSNRPILDFPGLCCPRSVKANRLNPEGHRSLIALIDREKPEWLVLRPTELEAFRTNYAATASGYQERKRFYADPEHVVAIGKLLWADGFELTIDEEFIVLRRQDS